MRRSATRLERSCAEEPRHRTTHHAGEKVPHDESGEEEESEGLQTSVAGDRRFDLEEHTEDEGVDTQRRCRVDERPQPSKDTALVLELQFALREIGDQAAVSPNSSESGHNDIIVRVNRGVAQVRAERRTRDN